ncbi:MAG: SGNH/GDSL hydrolase family protein [Vicinamibacterales bacterium]
MKTPHNRSIGRRVSSRAVRAAVLVCAFVTLHHTLFAQGPAERWIGTWSTSEVGRPQVPPPPAAVLPPFMANQCPAVPAPAPVTPPPGQTFAPVPFTHFANQTVRQIIHASVGGSRARVVVSNAYGTAALTVGAGYIALRDKDGAIQAKSGRPLTFSGNPTMTVPANAVVYSDPVDLAVPAMADLAIDLYLPGSTNTVSPLTMHTGAFQTTYVSETGNHAGKVVLPAVATIQNWFLLSRVEVVAPDAGGAIVAFGDSITDGTRSTPDTNNRWPDHLARRMRSRTPALEMGILNAGIAGNRVLSEGAFNAGINALARFELDALSQSGVTHIIVLEGINDIGTARQNPTPTAEDIIAGHKQLIARAHSRGLKIYGATLTPFWGAAYYTDVGEAKRQAVNAWIRTSKAYDAVIDFDNVTRDPNDPRRLLAAFDSCDHLHPNDAGYKAMADAIDLDLFKPGQMNRSSNGSSR